MCSFKKIITYLRIIISIKGFRGTLDNNLTLTFYNRSVHSIIKTKSEILKLVYENLLCCTCVRRRKHMRVLHPINTYDYFLINENVTTSFMFNKLNCQCDI